jgi:hypothetical protein
MTSTRAAVLSLLAIGAAAAAIAVSIGVRPGRSTVGELTRRPVPTAVDPVVLALSDGQARMAASRQTRRPLPVASRDPFRFNAGPSGASEPPSPRKGAVLSTRTPQPALPAQPTLTLSGVAEDRTGGVLVRTAIISTATGLYLVKEGERVEQRFEVLRIAATEVRLRDTVEQTDFTLTLR